MIVNSMRVTIRPKALFFLIVSIVLTICIHYVEDMKSISLIALVVMIPLVMSVASAGYGFISIPVILIVLTYVFHCSQFLVNIFDESYLKYFDIQQLLGGAESINMMRYAVTTITVMVIGLLFASSHNRGITPTPWSLNNNLIYSCGKILMCLCFAPRLYADIAFAVVGYMNMGDALVPGFIHTLSEGFYIGAALCIVGRNKDVKYCRVLLSTMIAYALIMMMSGRRQVSVSYIILMSFVYYKFVHRKEPQRRGKLLSIILLVFVFFVGLVIIATIGDIRNKSAGFWDTFWVNFSFKIFADQVGEFGGTGISLGYAMRYFPSFRPYNYGLTYIESLITILPNIGGVQDELIRSLDYIYSLPSTVQLALGGSFIGELYYNFGYLGQYFACIIGLCIGKISLSIDYGATHGCNKNTLISLLFISPLILWVRGVFSYFIRTVVWFALILLIIKSFVSRKSINRGICSVCND